MANFVSLDRPGSILTFSDMSAAFIKLVVLVVLAHASSVVYSAEGEENLSPADKRLKQIQTEFESVDIDAKDYTEKRYAIFKTWVNEVVRLRGSRPYAALKLVEAQSHATTYSDKLEAEMLKEDPHVFDTGGKKTPSDAGKPAKAKDEKPPAPKSPMILKNLVYRMQYYIKMKDLKHAKEYAQKIVDDYPDTPEAGEAKTVIEKKE